MLVLVEGLIICNKDCRELEVLHLLNLNLNTSVKSDEKGFI